MTVSLCKHHSLGVYTREHEQNILAIFSREGARSQEDTKRARLIGCYQKEYPRTCTRTHGQNILAIFTREGARSQEDTERAKLIGCYQKESPRTCSRTRPPSYPGRTYIPSSGVGLEASEASAALMPVSGIPARNTIRGPQGLNGRTRIPPELSHFIARKSPLARYRRAPTVTSLSWRVV